jgi:hypothetical protein
MTNRDETRSGLAGCLLLLLPPLSLFLVAPLTAQDGQAARPTAEVAGVLDALHEAAAAADEPRYFGLFAKDAVFLGTDPDERWTVEEFRAYAHPHFERGTGWTYVPRPGRRHVMLSRDGGLAWFDEVLDNEKYGECRGTGVLVRVDGEWKIAHYSLTLPIPNDLALEVVERIRESRAP